LNREARFAPRGMRGKANMIGSIRTCHFSKAQMAMARR
jgi:hypothetical protein